MDHVLIKPYIVIKPGPLWHKRMRGKYVHCHKGKSLRRHKLSKGWTSRPSIHADVQIGLGVNEWVRRNFPNGLAVQGQFS